ncbi:topoisomerase DNA-binding C4 zinc finger domain-containing protein [Alteromonas flava]|uniref:DNA topoisomerase family protein n=1 Tax=Alteromonas flava TaxID=2048003 RepID=UPI000C28DAA4|nr:topoisomerase DNA-binding C4 zinc finger domain-containing protein [Alteromonas flava]
MSKINHALFSASSHALSAAFGDCPECGSPLVVKRGKSGAFIGCSTYPTCDYTKPLHDNEVHVVKVIDSSSCPECGHELAVKKGRYGLFIGCTNMPECHHIESLKQQADTQVECPVCHKGHLVKRTNRFGKHFYSCNQFPNCKYVVNHPPVAQACKKCQWPILLKIDNQLVCPQTQCGEKQLISE